jgi:hypothetical protein
MIKSKEVFNDYLDIYLQGYIFHLLLIGCNHIYKRTQLSPRFQRNMVGLVRCMSVDKEGHYLEYLHFYRRRSRRQLH